MRCFCLSLAGVKSQAGAFDLAKAAHQVVRFWPGRFSGLPALAEVLGSLRCLCYHMIPARLKEGNNEAALWESII